MLPSASRCAVRESSSRLRSRPLEQRRPSACAPSWVGDARLHVRQSLRLLNDLSFGFLLFEKLLMCRSCRSLAGGPPPVGGMRP